jgi:alkyl sulfatase BDS1-like metallo-beta-lactamase superfamily hydrolase
MPLLSFGQQVLDAGDPTQAGTDQAEALRINDFIYQATGFGNTFLVITAAGNVIIDTSLAANAPRHKELLQRVDDGPIRYIILTHGHGDHTGGISTWRESGTEIIAQQNHVEFANYQRRLAGLFGRRNAAQFPGLARQITDNPARQGTRITTEAVNYGATIEPTILFDERYRFELGGITFELYSTPGETYDHLTVWLPQYSIAFVGDNFYGSFPNMYTLRGTKPRWALDYVESLNKVLDLKPEIVLPSHGVPVYGNAVIEQQLGKYRDAILYVHDQTVVGMNQGKDVFTLMQEIELPSDLVMGEGYGEIGWAVRGIYENYIGWFDGNPATMYAIPPSATYPELVALAGGAGNVATSARTLLDNGETVKALHMADIALTVEGNNRAALQVRLDALQRLLAESVNSNEVGWLQFGIRTTRTLLEQGQ